MKPNLSEQEKLEYAKSLGVSAKGLYDTNGNLYDWELDSRILERERANRDEKLWIVAVVASVASALSALAAWAAVLSKNC